MERLPVEILSHIMKYLNHADQREFALACKKFYNASLDPDLHWDSTFVFDAYALVPENESFDQLHFYCKSPNLCITGLSENINVKPLINPKSGCMSILGPHIQKLSLKGSSILEGSFVEILKKCESLEALDITSCKDLFLIGSFLTSQERYSKVAKVLAKTTDLNLSSIRYMTDACLKTLTGLCPELASVMLASCNILFSEFGSTQRHALTFPCLLQIVAMRSSTLQCIDLSRTSITNSALKDLATVKGLHLKEVVLQSCRQEKPALMTKCLPTTPSPTFVNLTKLSISSGKYVTDLTIQSIFMNLTNLEQVCLSWCHYITDRGLVGLEITMSEDKMFPAVEKANADFLSTARYSTSHGRSGFLGSPGCEFITHVNWNEFDSASCLKSRGIGRLRRLRRLALSNCRNVTDESFVRIFCVGEPVFPQMEQLELNMMQRSVTDDVLNGISIGCPLLTKLSISCSNVTDTGIDSVTHRLRRLGSSQPVKL